MPATVRDVGSPVGFSAAAKTGLSSTVRSCHSCFCDSCFWSSAFIADPSFGLVQLMLLLRWVPWACICSTGWAGLLPLHLHCGQMGRYQTSQEAADVWRRLGSDKGFRADKTCCSLDKIDSVLEYTALVLDFKVKTMEQQRDYARQIQESLGRSRSESPCQPMMRGRFVDRLEALQLVALPLGLKGISLQRESVLLTLRLATWPGQMFACVLL